MSESQERHAKRRRAVYRPLMPDRYCELVTDVTCTNYSDEFNENLQQVVYYIFDAADDFSLSLEINPVRRIPNDMDSKVISNEILLLIEDLTCDDNDGEEVNLQIQLHINGVSPTHMPLMYNSQLKSQFRNFEFSQLSNVQPNSDIKLQVVVTRKFTIHKSGVRFLGKLLETQDFMDLTVVYKDQEYQAHKNILASSSPVFDQIIRNEMIDDKIVLSNELTVSQEAVKVMIRFIYTGNFDVVVQENIQDLLLLANKYKLESLKHFCADAMFKQIRVENAGKLFIYAHECKCSVIKEKIIDFILDHFTDVSQTESYALLMQSHSFLANQIVMQCLEKSKRKNTKYDDCIRKKMRFNLLSDE